MTDDNIRSMRDQGIADACNGEQPFCWFADCDGNAEVIGCRGPSPAPYWLLPGDGIWYREAFAYARAYSAELER